MSEQYAVKSVLSPVLHVKSGLPELKRTAQQTVSSLLCPLPQFIPGGMWGITLLPPPPPQTLSKLCLLEDCDRSKRRKENKKWKDDKYPQDPQSYHTNAPCL